MGQPRNLTMNPHEIELHHAYARVVQQMYLMGEDPLTGKDYSYRRARLVALHEYLASVLAVEVGSLNVMSNHFHNLLRNRPDLVKKMTDEEVVWRYRKAWPRYYPGKRKWDCAPTDDELDEMLLRAKNEPDYMPRVRTRLGDISFFMGRLEQTISRQANKEKPTTGGHFWDGSYGNRRIDTDEDAISSFLYCDLQQAKAGMVNRLEDSSYSSIQAQIKAHAEQAFEDFHRRKPTNSESDEEELDQLSQMFANCAFSPLVADAPLITESDDDPPASEYVLPAGYLYQQTADTHDAEGEPIASDQPPDVPTASKKKRGRPKKKRSRSIHDRLKLKQRRRASRCNILGLSWEQYSPLVQQIAEELIRERRRVVSRRAQDTQASSSIAPMVSNSDSEDGSRAKFKRSITGFGHWLATQATEAFTQLVNLRATRPRPPSELDETDE